MRTARPTFHSGIPGVPRTTKWLMIVFAGLSIVNALFRANLQNWMVLYPELVFGGQLWRLITYPFLALDPLGVLFGLLGLYFIGAALERIWGARVFQQRLAIFILVPALLTTALALLIPPLRAMPSLGLHALLLGFITAFAAGLGQRQIILFPLPIPLSGDQVLMLEAVLLGLYVIFQGPLAHMTSLFTFGLALAWFRFDAARDLRRFWLRLRKRRIETKVEKLRQARNLRVVRSEDLDDDGPNSRFLH